MNKFLILGNMNAITYKEVFSRFKNNELFIGYEFNKSMEFILPQDSKIYKREENGVKYASVSIGWYTNIKIDRKIPPLELTKEFNIKDYPLYDNYLAFNVNRTKDIPKNEYIEIEIDPKDYPKWKAVYGDDLEIIKEDENKN